MLTAKNKNIRRAPNVNWAATLHELQKKNISVGHQMLFGLQQFENYKDSRSLGAKCNFGRCNSGTTKNKPVRWAPNVVWYSQGL